MRRSKLISWTSATHRESDACCSTERWSQGEEGERKRGWLVDDGGSAAAASHDRGPAEHSHTFFRPFPRTNEAQRLAGAVCQSRTAAIHQRLRRHGATVAVRLTGD